MNFSIVCAGLGLGAMLVLAVASGAAGTNEAAINGGAYY